MLEKVKFIFINQTFSNLQDEIKLFQTVENSEGDFEIKTKVIDLEELNSIYENFKNSQTVKLDFEIKDGFLKCENVTNTKLTDIELKNMKGVSAVHKPHIITIYDLFKDIVSYGGYYLDKTEIDNLGKEEWLSATARFIPNYSKSTMTVSLSVRLPEKWVTRKLIYVNEGRLQPNEFYFFVDEMYKDKFSKYNIEFVGNYKICGKERSIFRSADEVNIYGYTGSSLQIFPSLLNRYTFMSEAYGAIAKSCDLICKALSMDTAEAEEPKKFDRSKYVSRYTNSYVTLSLSRKSVTNERRQFFITDIIKNVLPAIKGSDNPTLEVFKHLKSLRLDYLENVVYVALADILVKDINVPMDRLERCIKTSKEYKIRKMFADTFLYLYRSCLYYTNVRIGLGDMKILEGSDIPYVTIMKRRKADA